VAATFAPKPIKSLVLDASYGCEYGCRKGEAGGFDFESFSKKVFFS